MSAARLAASSRAAPAGREPGNPGAHDPHTAAQRARDLPGAVDFAGDSPQWGGGCRASRPRHRGGPVAARYLITAEQFADARRRKCHRGRGRASRWTELVLGGIGGVATRSARALRGAGGSSSLRQPGSLLVVVGRFYGRRGGSSPSSHGIDLVGYTRRRRRA